MANQAHHYVDQESFKRYTANVGQEITASQLVNIPPADAFDAWLKHVWLADGKELHPGTGRGFVGHARGMRILNEEIIAAGEPQTNSDAIPSITYTANPPAVTDHIGFVRFIPDSAAASSTLVVWSAKITLLSVARVLCCGGGPFRAILRQALQYGLREFAKKVNK